jgi:hypothetical protein
MTREKIEAAYLYRFLDFVEFPPNAPAGSTSYSLCVMGDARLSETLAHVVEGKSLLRRPIVVRSLGSSDDAKACHLLFVTGRKSAVIEQLAKLQLEPILIVSDLPDAQDAGNVVTLSMKGDQMHFDINVDNAKKRKLLISSRLIQLSRSSQ